MKNRIWLRSFDVFVLSALLYLVSYSVSKNEFMMVLGACGCLIFGSIFIVETGSNLVYEWKKILKKEKE